MIAEKLRNLDRKWAVLGLAGLLLVLLAAIIFAVFILSRQPAVDSDDIIADSELPDPGSANMPAETLFPESDRARHDPDSTKLLVDLEYIRDDSFNVNILNIARTTDPPNSDQYQALPDFPYSILQIADADDEIFFEQRISLPTSVIFDAAEAMHSSVFPLERSENRLVIPLPDNKTPATVTILSATGETIDTNSFSFNNLPFDNVTATENDTDEDLTSGFLGIRPAEAQGSSTFKIVVINEVDALASLESVASQARSMINNISPWTEFEGRVEVVTITNEHPLNCHIFNFENFSYPICPTHPVTSVVGNEVPDWSTIIIVTNIACNCGSVMNNFPSVAAVGGGATSGILAHELGHSVGKMVDEYIYQFVPDNTPSLMSGPNCFNSRQQCENVTDRFPEANCVAGCNGGIDRTWRSSNRIMHNTYSPLEFGPYQHCLMGQAIARTIGESFSCLAESDPDPEPEPEPEAPRPVPAPGQLDWGSGR